MVKGYAFNESGEKIIARMDGVNSDMLMDVTVRRLRPGSRYSFCFLEKEAAVLLTEGELEFAWGNQKVRAKRSSVFGEKPWTLHVPRNVIVVLTALQESEVIIQSTNNEKDFKERFYRPEDCTLELMGADKWEGTAKREVLTVFDYKNAPYSNLVIGEVITKAGRWSSYIPHSHPQPEIYYYKFAKPQGFGAAFIGDAVYKVTDGAAAAITCGETHPQTAAPGYDMYYCWMIRHLDGNPWTTRDNDPAHVWLLDAD